MKKFIIALFVLSAGFVLATDYDIYVEAGVNEPQFIMQVPVGSTDTVTFNIMNDGVPITATNYTAKMYIDFDDSFGSARTITLTGSTSGSAATFTMTGPVIYSGLNNWYVRVEMGTTYFIDGKLQIDSTPLSKSGQPEAIATMGGTAEAIVDGKYAVTGGDATTGLMVQAANVTAAGTLETNAFAVVFGAAPIVSLAYTEDPGDVQPFFLGTVTASNFICTVTSSKNYNYIAVGARP